MKTVSKYSPEFRERAVRMFFERQGDNKTQWAAIVSIASKIGCAAETLRKWGRQAERDQGQRDRRLLKSIGNLPPAELELMYDRQHEESATAV
jgi:transposase-like protein